MLIAHRGVTNSIVKENTIPAFLGAINDPKYDGFEFDIYTSRDKEFVINHDPLVDGKFIWNLNYKVLKKKGIVKLEDVLKLNTDKIMLIEIKDINMDILKLTKLLNKYKNRKIYVMSFFNSVIKRFQNNNFKTGVLNYVLNSTSSYPYNFMGVLYDVASLHLINSLKKLNIEVFLYALNKKDKYIYDDVYYIVDDYKKNS